MKWKFRPMHPNEVESDVTQRDQFSNDDVDLSDTVVRESVQNSLDAQRHGSQVRVRFSLKEIEEEARELLDRCLDGQLDHARAASLDVDEALSGAASVLVIEDFGTVGLTGATDSKDNNNFSDFWRRHGKSHKSGKSGGRWGLGKLVYSYASGVGTFFGMTVRADDTHPYLMGQTVLNTHNCQGIQYAPHGFFADEIETGAMTGLQVPVEDEDLRQEFTGTFGLERSMDPGLSVVIPYPTEDIQLADMIRVGVSNYYFPVLTDQLVLTFNDVVVDRNTLQDVAEKYASGHIRDSDKVFAFVESAHEMPRDQLLTLEKGWYDDWQIDESDFSAETLETLRQRFADHELIGVTLKIDIKKKDGSVEESWFDLFLKTDPDLSAGNDMYVRGGITVPGEAKFKHRKALGVLVAQDEAISGFLGDAENAAHTKWNARAEKLRRKYRNPYQTLKAIRNSLVQLHDVLAHVVEEEAEDALLDFFWAPGADQARPKKGRRSPPKPDIPKIPRKPKPFQIARIRGGFKVAPSDAAASFEYPMRCAVCVAYDTERGNPFKNYQKFDFDFADKSQTTIAAKGVTVDSVQENRLVATIDSAEFLLELSGFDPRRDITVAVEVGELK